MLTLHYFHHQFLRLLSKEKKTFSILPFFFFILIIIIILGVGLDVSRDLL